VTKGNLPTREHRGKPIRIPKERQLARSTHFLSHAERGTIQDTVTRASERHSRAVECRKE
jgi:hypothetical protein